MSIYDLLPENQKESPAMFGVVVALVTKNDDEEGLGRVKCKFIAKDVEQETDWIRVATPTNGKEFGMFFLPEIDDEVLLAFAGGDISRPYVIGCLWSKVQMPPKLDKNKKNIFRGIKSKFGSKIAFDQAEDKDTERVYVNTVDGERELLLDEKNKLIKLHDKSNANLVSIDSAKGEITIKAEKKITLIVGNNKIIIDGMANAINIESDMKLNVKSLQINVEAGAAYALKSKATVEIQGTAVTKISGGMVNING